jgi:two-component system, NarL family, response regulator DegU
MKNNLIVYLADDHTVARKGMGRLLTTFDRVQTIDEAANGRELIDLCKKNLPHAVILDIEMPIMGGEETARYINIHFPSVKILVLTMHTEDIFINRLVDIVFMAF